MNVKKQFRVSGFIRKTTALHVHQTLWYTFFDVHSRLPRDTS